MTDDIHRLAEIGFRCVGYWYLTNKGLKFKLDAYSDRPKVLYAFVHGDQVLYVGKTVRPLAQRMNQYRRPGSTQRTNQKNNRNVLEMLRRGKSVEIWVFADENPVRVGCFDLNLAAGLEDSVIEVLQPKWNGTHGS